MEESQFVPSASAHFNKRMNIKWLEMMLSVFFTEWKQNSYFKDKIKKLLWKTFNKKLPDYLQEIYIKGLTIKGDAPIIKDLVQ